MRLDVGKGARLKKSAVRSDTTADSIEGIPFLQVLEAGGRGPIFYTDSRPDAMSALKQNNVRFVFMSEDSECTSNGGAPQTKVSQTEELLSLIRLRCFSL
jgi:hypothetical protein